MASKKKTAGMSDLEKKLLEDNEKLTKEVAWLKDLLQQFGHQLIDCEDEDWICPLCGKREPLAVEVANFGHETFCPLHKE